MAAFPAAVQAQQIPGFAVAQPTQSAVAPPQQPAAIHAVKPHAKRKPKLVTSGLAETEGAATAGKGGSERIVMLVNDDPITARDIEQRTRFLSASNNVGPQAQEIFKRLAQAPATSVKFRAMVEGIIKANQGKMPDKKIMALIEQRKQEFGMSLQRQAMEQARSSVAPKFRQDAINELIEEKLKLQAAKKEKIEVTDAEVTRILEGIAARNKQTMAQFAQGLKSAGADISTMRARFKASFAWRDTVRKTFGAQIQVIEPEIEKFIAEQAKGKGGADTQELEIQRILFTLPGKLAQAGMVKALADADEMRQRYSGCKSMAALIKDSAVARFEAAKYVKPSAIAEPTRSLLLGAKDGELLPPQTATDGVELVAICGRRSLGIDDTQRAAATQELSSRQFEDMANRRLRELRQQANIEYRE